MLDKVTMLSILFFVYLHNNLGVSFPTHILQMNTLRHSEWLKPSSVLTLLVSLLVSYSV